MTLRSNGFTLLELLIAVAVFAMLSVMSFEGLTTLLDSQRSTQSRSQQLRELQRTLIVLNEDLMQTVSRGVRDEYGTDEAPLRGGLDGELLTLTRSAADLESAQGDHRLLRISYRFEDGHLYRWVWPILDRTQQTQAIRRRLMSAEHVAIRFYDGDWYGSWPQTGGIPDAVEIRLQLPGLGEVYRGFGLK